MSEADFFSDEAKRAAADSVRAVEANTCAELVVAVRKSSGGYGVAAYHFGLAVTACVVAYLLVSPTAYSDRAIALDAIAAFALGTVLAANFDTLKRALLRRRTLEHHVASAARAAFFDLGITKTAGRSGILVYVSLFERTCVVLADVGIEAAALEPAWSTALGQLESAVRRRHVPAFRSALESLGPVLGARHPRSEDDVNELSDEVQ